MEQKNSKIFSKETMQTVSAFCDDENIKDIDNFIYLCFKQGFDIKRYGLLGKTLNEGEKDLKIGGEQEKQVIKEVIVEKRVEIPVEVIREVEKIVEVIKEVPVEKVVTKIEYISDKTTEDELGGIIVNLKNEMSKKDEELNEVRHNLDIILDKPPVEIIKEVEVIKEVENNEKLKMLSDTLQKLRKELTEKNKKIEELEKINQRPKDAVNAIFMKGSNLKDLL